MSNLGPIPLGQRPVELGLAGLGILMYSPTSASELTDGQDFLKARYTTEAQVQPYIQAGTLVSFGTSTPGDFILSFFQGYPTKARLEQSDFKLRLGLRCDGTVVFRDLYDLMSWTAEYPGDQAISLKEAIYHVTLCSNRPANGILGSHQGIDIYFQELDSYPRLADRGIPTLIL